MKTLFYALTTIILFLSSKSFAQIDAEEFLKLEILREFEMKYNSYKDFPSKIADGWHNVSEKVDHYDTRKGRSYRYISKHKVYVENNRVKLFSSLGNAQAYIVISDQIIRGKVIISALSRGSSTSRNPHGALKSPNPPEKIELYFMEDLGKNGMAMTSPPANHRIEGKALLWTGWKKMKPIYVFIKFPEESQNKDGGFFYRYVGVISEPHKKGEDVKCVEDSKSLLFGGKLGYYDFIATDNDDMKWTGRFLIKDGTVPCWSFELKKH